MYYTYILYSEKSQRYYTGQTSDLTNRITEHNSGETRSIRHGIPWILVWSEQFQTRAEAVKKELFIKGRGAKRFLEDSKVD